MFSVKHNKSQNYWSLFEIAVKRTIQLFHDKGLFNNCDIGDKVLKDYELTDKKLKLMVQPGIKSMKSKNLADRILLKKIQT